MNTGKSLKVYVRKDELSFGLPVMDDAHRQGHQQSGASAKHVKVEKSSILRIDLTDESGTVRLLGSSPSFKTETAADAAAFNSLIDRWTHQFIFDEIVFDDLFAAHCSGRPMVESASLLGGPSGDSMAGFFWTLGGGTT